VIFKDLQKLVQQSQQEQQRNSNSDLFERLRDKSFWIWNVEEHKQEDVNTKGVAALIISADFPQSTE
jgi:hypothetical protein